MKIFIEVNENNRVLEIKQGRITLITRGKHLNLSFCGSRYITVDREDLLLKVKQVKPFLKQLEKFAELEVLRIGENEALMLRVNGKLEPLRHSGIYAIWKDLQQIEISRHKKIGIFLHADLEVMFKTQKNYPELEFRNIAEGEVGILRIDGHIRQLLKPGLNAWWRDDNTSFETVSSKDILIKGLELYELKRCANHQEMIATVDIPAQHRGLIYSNGENLAEFKPGRYLYWRDLSEVKVQLIDMRERHLDISGQEMMTADKLSLRVNLTIHFKVVQAAIAIEQSVDYESLLYREAQLLLRQAIGTRELESLLGERGGLQLVLS